MSDRDSDEGVAPDPEAHVERADHRTINRIPVRLAVSQKGRSAPLGRTRDVSLQGLFIETREPFDVGAVLPLSIEFDARRPLTMRAEVVRKTHDGMGLRFRDLDKETNRRLRRWVVDHTSVAGSRRQVEQLIEESARIEPIRNPDRIRSLLADMKSDGAQITLIPTERVARDYARLVAVETARDRDGKRGESVVFHVEGGSSLVANEDIYALLTLQFVSYSFALRVRAVDATLVRCELPELIVFSERRGHHRVKAPTGSVIRWPSPWQRDVDIELPLVDLSDDGLSFRAANNTLITPGTPLEGASVTIEGRTQPLASPEVRNVVRVEDDTGVWLRVGVALGPARLGKQDRAATRVRAKTPIGRLVDRVKTTLSVVLHRGRERFGGSSNVGSRRITVRGGNLPIIGILDRTSDEDERIAAPLVIVVPGFAGRKEQLSFLAGTIIEGFQRQNADVAVLRIDGTNNLGESGKDPDCQQEGMHCMHYTVTGSVQDALAALAWAKKNNYVDPTHIVMVSVSVASIAVRHVMTLPEAGDVSLWFSYMGAADAIDSIKNVSGNIDFHSYFMRGEKVGTISLNGVLNDGDHFWKDLHDNGIGYLDNGRAEMAKVNADVVWLRGKHDAYMDPRRVDALMRMPAIGAREIIDVDGGHVPRTGDEAIAQFIRVTQRIWKHVHSSAMPAFTPSIGRLAVKAEGEWKKIRKEQYDRTDWWRNYLLDDQGVGFDILEYQPEYVELIELTARRTLEGLELGGGQRPVVMELGAGTGNLARRLVQTGVRVIATDLVAEALAAFRAKIAASDDQLETAVVDLEGSPWLAMKRFCRGDLPGAMALAERLPGVQKGMLNTLLEHDGDDLHGLLVGHDIDLAAFTARARLQPLPARLLADLNLFARVVRGRVSPEAARSALSYLPPSLLDGNRGLSQADASVDAVALSLVLSYLSNPEDAVSEAWRVLRPGGRLVVTSLVPDSDSSRMYLDLVNRLENLPEGQLPVGKDPAEARAFLANAARRFVDHAAELYRLEEEGQFRFYTGPDLASLVVRRGFVDARIDASFGSPPQAVVVSCRKP